MLTKVKWNKFLEIIETMINTEATFAFLITTENVQSTIYLVDLSQMYPHVTTPTPTPTLSSKVRYINRKSESNNTITFDL